MSDVPTAHSPIVIDRVERSRGGGDSVRLRVTGHRPTVASEAELDTLLVVRLHGRRHRFAASKTGDDDPSPGPWEASFSIPIWAVPVEYGQALLWVGETAVEVPPVGTRVRLPDAALASPGHEPAGPPVEAAALAAAAVEAGRAGPLADALLRETVAALRVELEQQSRRAATLDEALERARAELVGRTASQAELEATHEGLRAELGRLVEAVAELAHGRDDVERIRAELAQVRGEAEQARSELAQARAEADHALREQVATTSISRDAAIAEASGLRAELSRLGSELALARELSGARDGELDVAQQLLEDARALTAQFQEGSRA